jgi:hypothetical protein
MKTGKRQGNLDRRNMKDMRVSLDRINKIKMILKAGGFLPQLQFHVFMLSCFHVENDDFNRAIPSFLAT